MNDFNFIFMIFNSRIDVETEKMISEPVVKPEIRKFAENVVLLGKFLDAETWQRPTTPTIRPDTLEVLENANQLLQNAKMTIAEVTHQNKYHLDSRYNLFISFKLKNKISC